MAEEVVYSESLKIALYAETGGRKTLQIGNLIEGLGAENVGIISCEHGLGTIQSKIDPQYVRPAHNMAELRAAYMWAASTFKSPAQFVCVDGGSRVLNWIRDDLIAGTNRVYEQLLDGVKRTDLNSTDRPYAFFVTNQNEINMQAIWIRVGMEADRLMNSFVRLPASMYWTFWEELTNVDQYSKGPPFKPDTPGKGAFDAIKGTFDFVFRLVKDGDTSTALCDDGQPRKYYAKRRDDWAGGIKVPNEIKDFNLAAFVKMLRKEG